jgi:hypothetical protein
VEIGINIQVCSSGWRKERKKNMVEQVEQMGRSIING